MYNCTVSVFQHILCFHLLVSFGVSYKSFALFVSGSEVYVFLAPSALLVADLILHYAHSLVWLGAFCTVLLDFLDGQTFVPSRLFLVPLKLLWHVLSLTQKAHLHCQLYHLLYILW